MIKKNHRKINTNFHQFPRNPLKPPSHKPPPPTKKMAKKCSQMTLQCSTTSLKSVWLIEYLPTSTFSSSHPLHLSPHFFYCSGFSLSFQKISVIILSLQATSAHVRVFYFTFFPHRTLPKQFVEDANVNCIIILFVSNKFNLCEWVCPYIEFFAFFYYLPTTQIDLKKKILYWITLY